MDVAILPNEFILQNLEGLQNRIVDSERFLRLLGKKIPKLQISILKNKPYFFVLENNHLWIGEKLVFASGHLERALFKNWMRSQWAHTFVHHELAEDVLADLFYVAAFGQLEIQDPAGLRQIQYEPTTWPQVLQSVQGYCDSPWRSSEHYEFCLNIKPSQSVISSQVLERSLRPLLSAAMIESFHQLSISDRLEFALRMAEIFTSPHLTQLPVVKNNLFPLSNEQNQMRTMLTLVEASEYLKNMSRFFSSSSLVQRSTAYRQFVTGLGQQILKSGFTETFSELNFDLLFTSETKIHVGSPTLAQFQEIQKKFPQTRIALKDKENIWILPSRYSLPLKSLGRIKADRAIIEQCTSLSFENILSYDEDFQRVLLVGTCQANQVRNYSGFMREGAAGFARLNPYTSFVQIHIPSAMLKKEELTPVQNIFEFLKNRDSHDQIFQSLGWQELKWNQSLNAYTPRAYVDAIELFRDKRIEAKESKAN
jgi:hypothetical protein